MLDEILEERVSSSRGRRNVRGVKQKMSNWPIRPRSAPCNCRIEVVDHIVVVGVPRQEYEDASMDVPDQRVRELAEYCEVLI